MSVGKDKLKHGLGFHISLALHCCCVCFYRKPSHIYFRQPKLLRYVSVTFTHIIFFSYSFQKYLQNISILFTHYLGTDDVVTWNKQRILLFCQAT